jgi:hypothetical protein
MSFTLYLVGLLLALLGLLAMLAGQREAAGFTPEKGKTVGLGLLVVGLILFALSWFI